MKILHLGEKHRLHSCTLTWTLLRHCGHIKDERCCASKDTSPSKQGMQNECRHGRIFGSRNSCAHTGQVIRSLIWFMSGRSRFSYRNIEWFLKLFFLQFWAISFSNSWFSWPITYQWMNECMDSHARAIPNDYKGETSCFWLRSGAFGANRIALPKTMMIWTRFFRKKLSTTTVRLHVFL